MPPTTRRNEELDRQLDQAVERSFPASDPPQIFGDASEERDTPEGEYK